MTPTTAERVRTLDATVPKTEPSRVTGAETVVRALEMRGT
jgi:hypothetical protein